MRSHLAALALFAAAPAAVFAQQGEEPVLPPLQPDETPAQVERIGPRAPPPAAAPAEPAAAPEPAAPLPPGSALETVPMSETPVAPPEKVTPPPTFTDLPGLDGGAGLLRVRYGSPAQAGNLRIGLQMNGWFANDFPAAAAQARAVAGRLALGYAILPELDVFASIKSASFFNVHTTPTLIQSLGDFSFGTRGAYALGTAGLSFGGELLLGFPSAIETPVISIASAQAQLRALATFDGEEAGMGFPLRAHLNLGIGLDNSQALIPRDADGNPRTLTAEEKYSLGISTFHRFIFGVAAEVSAPGASWLQGFFEFSGEIPLGGGAGAQQLRLTPGVRFRPGPGVALDLAGEIGLGGALTDGFAPAPPFTLHAAASFAFDPVKAYAPPPPPRVERVVVREPAAVPPPPMPPPPSKGQVGGRVNDARSGAPLAGVIITPAGQMPAASGAEGKFLTADLAPGKVTLTLERAGYRLRTVEAKVTAGQVFAFDVTLEPAPPQAGIAGRVVAQGTGTPVANAQLTVLGLQKRSLGAPQGSFFAADLPPGVYAVTAFAEGYLARAMSVQVEAGQVAPVIVTLAPRPVKPLVTVGEDGKIALAAQPKFAEKKSDLPPDAAPLADELADLILSGKLPGLVRIESHIERAGKPADAKALTQARAQALAKALLERGVEPARLEAAGMGFDKPVLPGASKKAKDANRRIEIIVPALEPMAPMAPIIAPG